MSSEHLIAELIDTTYTLVDAKRGKAFYDIDMDEIKMYIEVNDPKIEDQHYYLITHEKNSVSLFQYDINDNITKVRLDNLLRFKNKN